MSGIRGRGIRRGTVLPPVLVGVYLLAAVVSWPSSEAARAQSSQPPASRFRTHTDTYPAPRFTTVEAWQRRAAYLREHVLASAGLLPLPDRNPLRPVVFGEVPHDDYIGLQGLLREPAGFLRHRQSVSAVR